MEARIYGVLDRDNCLIDTSKTLLGAKQYATRNGYKKIGCRVGYNVVEVWERVNKKWRKEN